MAENRDLALVLKLVADQFQSELKKSGGLLGDFQKVIGDWKVQLTAVGTALFAVAKSTANFGEEALKGAQRAGMTVEQFSALSYAAKLADIDQQQLTTGLKALSQNMVEASQRTGDGEALFRRLGIAATDAEGKLRPTQAVLLDLAEVFARSADGAGKTEAAVKLFGKAGVELIPFLNQGKAGIQSLMAEAERLGVVLSKDQAEAANRFNDALKKMESAARGLTLQIGQELLPSLTQLFEAMAQMGSGIGTQVIKGEFQGLAALFTLLNHGIRETAAELDVFWKKLGASPAVKKFWDDALVEGRKRLDADTSKKLHQIFSGELGIPGGMQQGGAGAAASGGPSKPEIPLGPDLKKLQEDYRLYITGLTSMGEELLKKKQENFQLYITGLTSAGEQYRAAIKGTGDEAVKLFQEHRQEIAKDRDILIENERAWIAYGDQLGASTEFMLQHRMDLLRMELAKELDLNVEQAGRLLLAWQNHDDELAASQLARVNKTATEIETIQLRTLARSKQTIAELSGDFLEGWAQGLRRYATDQTMFGLAADMSRRFFQTTEQGIQRFLFDAAEGRLQRLRDVAKSILSIVNQLVSQMASQVLMRGLASAFANAAPSLFNFGGGSQFTGDVMNPLKTFATGGRFMVGGTGGTDSQLVAFRATPGETVDVRTPGQATGVNLTFVVNNQSDATVSQPTTSVGPDGRQIVELTIRSTVSNMIRSGDFDSPFGRRYGLTPSPMRR